jgi:hypothetical protein
MDPPSRKRKNKVKSVITASATKEIMLLAAQAPQESKDRLTRSSHRSRGPAAADASPVSSNLLESSPLYRESSRLLWEEGFWLLASSI